MITEKQALNAIHPLSEAYQRALVGYYLLGSDQQISGKIHLDQIEECLAKAANALGYTLTKTETPATEANQTADHIAGLVPQQASLATMDKAS
jgi:hypothetical protein